MIKILVHRKITTWVETEVDVDASDVREAIEKYNSPSLKGCTFVSAKEIAGVRRPLTVKENEYQPTLEIYSPGLPGELWNNKNGYYIK